MTRVRASCGAVVVIRKFGKSEFGRLEVRKGDFIVERVILLIFGSAKGKCVCVGFYTCVYVCVITGNLCI